MSLVVVNEEGLYADRRISVDLASHQQVWTQAQKLFLSEDGTVGFGVAGQIDSNDNLHTVLKLLAIGAHHYVNHNKPGLFDVCEQLENFKSSMREISVFVITTDKTMIYSGNTAQVVTMSDPDHAMGTGRTTYEMFKRNDVSTPEALKRTADNILTVGRVFDHIARSSLLPVSKPNIFKPTPHVSLKKRIKDKRSANA